MGKDKRPSITSRLQAMVRRKYDAGDRDVSRLTDWYQSELNALAAHGEQWAAERCAVNEREGYRRDLVAILKDLSKMEVTIYYNGTVERVIDHPENRGLTRRDDTGKVESYTRKMFLDMSREEFLQTHAKDRENYRRLGAIVILEDFAAKCFEIHPEAATVGEAFRLSGFDTKALAIHRA